MLRGLTPKGWSQACKLGLPYEAAEALKQAGLVALASSAKPLRILPPTRPPRSNISNPSEKVRQEFHRYPLRVCTRDNHRNGRL
jgi:hypothetical protein